MTCGDLAFAWTLIEECAKERGVPLIEVREKMKARIAKLWEEEECGIDTVQTLHKHFSSPPSVEAAITLLKDLAIAVFGTV